MLMFKRKTDHKTVQQAAKNALSLSDCLAKTYLSSAGKKCPGRTVLSHCHIVGEVAREIIKRMPDWLRERLFPEGSELIAAAHDLGKVSPTFQEKIYRGSDDKYIWNSKNGLEGIEPDLEKQWGGHGGVSQAAVHAMAVGSFIPEILGQHHGYSPNLAGRISTDAIFGGKTWQERREELLVELKALLGCDWPKVQSAVQAKALSGLTTVADWIGSSSWFEDPNLDWRPFIGQSLDAAGFIQPKLKSGLTFTDIFDFIPHDAQQKLIENATQPGVYILEAPMGYGKTEAAFYAAYAAMISGRATGVYFALPTQLTSDKIHTRFNAFLKKTLASDCRHREALLLHSNAWLKQTEMGEEGQPGGSWFHAGKRGILAPFAVGTIDQALMAVMNVKHGFVRAFGLVGKVVILDEVHSYDAYTGTILDTLIKALCELGCTVIILSATLTRQRRHALLDKEPVKQEYPLISALSKDSTLREIQVEASPDAQVTIQLCQEDNKAIEEVLLRAEQGQQVLWIENTVDEAQARYTLLASRAGGMNITCGLLHSRFLKVDRDANESNWVMLYGKDNHVLRQTQGRILIGTQVLEQSLDIDADFLVTRICPTDMLLQRLGRLWRHVKTPRPVSAVQEAWILTPALTDAIENPEKSFGKTAKVYSPYVLCRSLEVWEKLSAVALPGQIRFLIEATYVERHEANAMNRYQGELQEKRKKLERLALVGLSQGGQTLPESKASTRYSEQDIVEVLLLRGYKHKEDRSGTHITLLNGEEIYLPRNEKKQDRKEWREKAAMLMKNTVHVAEYLAPNPISLKNLYWLEGYLYLGNKLQIEERDESLLRVAKVQDSGELLGIDMGIALTGFQLFYDAEKGYQAKKQ